MARAKDEGRRISKTGTETLQRGRGTPLPTASRQRTAAQPRRHQTQERTGLPVQRVDLWEEMDWVAVHCGLTPTEKAVLAMARLEEYSHAEIAAELGLTRRQVSETLVDA